MRILSFDIESTSGSHSDGSMCSFGYCIADEQFNIISQKDLVMKPKTKRFESRIKLHYDKAFIKAQPPFTEFYQDICNLFDENDYIVGFSISNDVDFLNNACFLYGLKKINYSFLDVQLLYKKVFDKPSLSGLEGIATELGIEYEAHRSDEDARVTLLVLKYICKRENLSLEEVLKRYHISLGFNNETETVGCSDGTLSKTEKKYLVHTFKTENYKHNPRYKGGLSRKNFAFSDDISYGDIDLFRNILFKIYSLNGRVTDIESSNTYITIDIDNDKNKEKIDDRNKIKKHVQVISLTELLESIGEISPCDFSDDYELIKKHKQEIRKQREEKHKGVNKDK